MKKLIFSNDIQFIRSRLKRNANGFLFCALEDNSLAKDISGYLSKMEKAVEIDRNGLFRQTGRDFGKKYSLFIADLNRGNYSRDWWALNSFTKNPLSTGMLNKIFYVSVLAKIISEMETGQEILVIINDDPDVLRTIKKKFDKAVVVEEKISKPFSFKETVKIVLPVSILYMTFMSVLGKFLSWLLFGRKFNREIPYTVVMSLLYDQCFVKGSGYRDVYFDGFLQYLQKMNMPFISFMEVCGNYLKYIFKLKMHGKYPIIIPKEYFSSFTDIVNCSFISLIKYYSGISLKGNLSFDSIDCSLIIKNSIRMEYRSTRFFRNMFMHFSVKSISRKVDITRFYYPFENRSFEKLMVLALRQQNPKTTIIGYQHASITLKHINFYIEEAEKDIVPLPDTIFTMGRETRDIMNEIFMFPKGMVKEGCALRKAKINTCKKEFKGKLRNILVILATDYKEYVGVFMFLNKALSGESEYNVLFRPHPVVSFEEALKIAPPLEFKYEKQTEGSINDAFNWADIVLYVSSTVGLEAISAGIPVVYLDIGDFLDTDPIFRFNDFKYTCLRPEDLKSIIKSFEMLTSSEIECKQGAAIEYARGYFYPDSEDNIRRFLN